MVVDADIISYVSMKNRDLKKGSESAYARILKWLMCQFDHIIQTQKEYLPLKV